MIAYCDGGLVSKGVAVCILDYPCSRVYAARYPKVELASSVVFEDVSKTYCISRRNLGFAEIKKRIPDVENPLLWLGRNRLEDRLLPAVRSCIHLVNQLEDYSENDQSNYKEEVVTAGEMILKVYEIIGRYDDEITFSENF